MGLHPASLPLGVDIEAWMRRAATPWDAFPDTRTGKMDAETCGLAAALGHPNVTLVTGAKVLRLLMAPDGKRVDGVECEIGGERRVLNARLIVLSAGAVNSPAALLLRSSERGVANRGDKVGRHFMNHKSSAVLAIDPRAVLVQYAYRTCKTDHHPVETCAMGLGENAVTTPDLRVRGIDGLRVVDASVMPFVPS